MKFATIFIYIMLSIPIIVIFLYGLLYPRDAVLWGKRWQFNNEDLEPSDEAIRYSRAMSIIGLIIMVIILIIVIIVS